MPTPAITEPAPALVDPAALPTPAQCLAAWGAPQRRWLWAAWAAGAGATLATIAQAGGLAWLIATAVATPAAIHWPAAVLVALAVVLRHALQGLRDWAGTRLAMAVAQSLRPALLEAAQRYGPMGMGRFGSAGEWAGRYQEQVEALDGYFSRYLPARGLAVVAPVMLLVAAAWLDWLAALLLLFSAPLIPLFMALVGLGAEQVHAGQQREQQRLAGHFLDRIRSLDLLRRSLALQAATAEVGAAAQRYRMLSMRVLRVAFLSSAVMEFFSAVAIGLVAIYVGFGLLGWISFGPAAQLSLFSGLFVLLLAPEYFTPLRSFAQSYHDRAAALAAAAALGPVLAGGADAAPGTAGPPRLHAPRPGEVLGLDAAVLGHAGQPALLAEVSLQLKPGEQVAVLGPSGSGKSSLLAACAGFLPLREGSLHLDPGAGFAWIGQAAHLFHGSIRDNLLLAAAPPPDAEAMREAMAAAGLPIDDPMLPDGLDTRVGEGGVGLSGGQAQRVGLARALLSGRPLWLLDEPTAAVDAQTAADLLGCVLGQARRAGVAVLVATHDESIAGQVDRCLRIAGKRLVTADG